MLLASIMPVPTHSMLCCIASVMKSCRVQFLSPYSETELVKPAAVFPGTTARLARGELPCVGARRRGSLNRTVESARKWPRPGLPCCRRELSLAGAGSKSKDSLLARP